MRYNSLVLGMIPGLDLELDTTLGAIPIELYMNNHIPVGTYTVTKVIAMLLEYCSQPSSTYRISVKMSIPVLNIIVYSPVL